MASIAASIGVSLLVSGIVAGATYALTPTQKLEAGRINDLTSSNSSYGVALPWAWGKVRLPGNKIWIDYLEETKSKKSGGKGSKVETTEFNYFGYYASMFAECPFRPAVDFQRLWMNKKLVYSKVGGAQTIASGGKFAEQYLRFYYGERSQPIDPLLQHTTPISNYSYGLPANKSDRDAYLNSLSIDPDLAVLTPGYNNRAYMLAQRLPLNDFFNALPRDEAELDFGAATTGQIVGDIMSLFFSAERYDVSLLDDRVEGFTLDSPNAAKNVIQVLQQAYFFDYVYSNGVYKFIPLKHPRDVVNLSKNDLAAHSSDSQKPLDFERIETDPLTLPSQVIVKYIDPDLNYDVNEQRSQLEFKSHLNLKPVRLNFNIVMSASEAATLADRAMALAWIQKQYTYKFQLPPAFLHLEPADLIPNLFDDREYPIKITQTRIGANLINDCEGVAHPSWLWDFVRVLEEGGITVGIADYNVTLVVNGTPNTVSDVSGNTYSIGTDYTVDSNGDIQILSTGNIPSGTELVISTTTQPTQSEEDLGSIVSAGDTELLVLDIPLIIDSDTDNTLYLAAGGGENWNGASIYVSTDNSRYVFADTIATYSIFGVTNSDFAGNQITVSLNKAELESITDNDLALGFNLALVGDEIIQFRTAQLTDTNTYILSDLTRGLRGTEAEINNHAVGDRFVLLRGDNAELVKLAGSSSDIGQVRYFKAVSDGQSLDEVTPVQLTIQGIAQRPYAPVNLSATIDNVGNITINWDRRDRHGLPNLSDTPEQYRVQIIDNSDDSTKRSPTTSTNSYTYQTSDQTLDFGSIQSTLYVKVAQVSATYGAGTLTQKTELTPTYSEPAPIITSFTPASALPGTTITVSGDYLAGATSLTINNIEQNNLAVIDNSTITFDLKYGTPSGLISITNDGGTTQSTQALIAETPTIASGFPTSKLDIALPHTINFPEFNAELVIAAESGVIKIPDLATDFPDHWGCWISLDGTGTVNFEREAGGTSGIIQSNSLGSNDTVKLWHRGGNIWKID